jgi:DNA-binding transcriptional LysR family regulator
MELRHLEQIVAVCRAGGFSGAARQLQISQPTLSKSISRLEAALTVKLFDRSGGTARPTAYGQFIADRAEGLLKAVGSLGRDLDQLIHGEAGGLRIGVGPVPKVKPLPQLIRRMNERYPNLQLEVSQETGGRLVRGAQEGRFDLVFACHELAREYGELIRVKVIEDRNIAAVVPGHPVTAEAPLSPRALLRYPIAATNLVPSFRRWLGKMSLNEAENLKSFVSDDYSLITRRALDDRYIAIGPRLVFESELALGRLVEVSLAASSEYECWMLTTPDRWRSPVIKAVAAFAREAAGLNLVPLSDKASLT